MANEIETLLNREIARCVSRVAECETHEAELLANPKLRAANDRERDRTFISLARALKMLRDLQKSAPKSDPATAQPEIPAQPPIARNAPCPCRSGQKYKRCCGRLAPPLYTAHTVRGKIAASPTPARSAPTQTQPSPPVAGPKTPPAPSPSRIPPASNAGHAGRVATGPTTPATFPRA